MPRSRALRCLIVHAALILACAAVASATQNAVVYGTVYDRQAKPIPGVQVTFENRGTGFSRTTTTAADGTYTFSEVPPGSGYRLTAFRDGRAIDSRGEWLVNVAEESVIFPALKEGNAESFGTIYGAVFDSSGKPMPGVKVELENAILDFRREEATTRFDGSYIFYLVRPGSGYKVTAIKDGKTLDIRAGITVNAGEEVVVLPALKAQQLTTRADPNPVPVASPTTGSILVTSTPAGAQVYLDNVFQGRTAQSDGQLVIAAVTPGKHSLRVSDDRLQDWTRDVQVAASERTSLQATMQAAGSKPLTVAEVEKALTGGVPKSRVAVMVKQYGVDFELTDEREASLRKLGADDKVIIAIMKNKK